MKNFNHFKSIITHIDKREYRLTSWINYFLLSIFLMVWNIPQVQAKAPYRFEQVWPKYEQSWEENPLFSKNSNDLVYSAHNRDFSAANKPPIRLMEFEGGVPTVIGFEGDWISEKGGIVRLWDWGRNGSGNGELSRPEGVAISSSDFVYVADTYNHRIQVFDSKGNFIGSGGELGTGPGQFNEPKGITVDASGLIYVVDTGNHRIQIFDNSGKFINSIGGFGAGDGQFNKPEGIAVSESGLIYVADTGNHRIQLFDARGKFIGSTSEEQSLDWRFYKPRKIAISASGLIYVRDNGWHSRTQVFSNKGKLIRNLSKPGFRDGKFDHLQEIAISANNWVYVADKSNHRIQVFDASGKFIRSWGEYGSEEGAFSNPDGIAISPHGLVYVADTENHRIQVFDANGKFIRKFGKKGVGDGKFRAPQRVAISTDELVYVTDEGNGRIQVFDAVGTFIRSWKVDVVHEGIAIGPDGLIYVLDRGIAVFDTSGKLIRRFYENAELLRGIAISPSGLIYVGDLYKNQVAVFDATGKFIESIGSLGTNYGQLIEPSGLAFNSEGALFIADTHNHRIQKFVRSKGEITTAHPRKAIIVAGGVPAKHNTSRLTQKAITALNLQGFQKNEIKYLTTANPQRDLDNNNQLDDMEAATLASLQQAVTEWASDATDVVIYLVDQSGTEGLQLNAEVISEDLLSQWINQLDERIPGKLTIIIEGNQSGRLVGALSAPQRIIISSADSDQPAVISHEGRNAFSYFFWSEISRGAVLREAFKTAREGMSQQLINGRSQNAKLDSNGDKQFSDEDYSSLGDYCLGICTPYAEIPARIVSVAEPKIVNDSSQIRLSMQVKSDGIFKAWVVITPVDLKHPDSNKVVSKLPQLPLQCDESQTCSAVYKVPEMAGDYQIVYFVLDKNEQLALPVSYTATYR